jgi:hypothetical protein
MSLADALGFNARKNDKTYISGGINAQFPEDCAPDFVFAADAHGLIQRVVQWS